MPEKQFNPLATATFPAFTEASTAPKDSVITREIPVVESDVIANLNRARLGLSETLIDPANLIRLAVGEPVEIFFLSHKEAEFVDPQNLAWVFDFSEGDPPREYCQLAPTQIVEINAQGIAENLLSHPNNQLLQIYVPSGQVHDEKPEYIIVVEKVNYPENVNISEAKYGILARAISSQSYQKELSEKVRFHGLVGKIIGRQVRQILRKAERKPELGFITFETAPNLDVNGYTISPDFLVERFADLFREKAVLERIQRFVNYQDMRQIAIDSILRNSNPPEEVVQALTKANLRLITGRILPIRYGHYQDHKKPIKWRVTDPNPLDQQPPEISVHHRDLAA